MWAVQTQPSECFLVHLSFSSLLLPAFPAGPQQGFILSTPHVHILKSLTARPHTWGDNADGHEQDMLLFMQIQLLQPHLELDEWLNQLQAVSSYKRERPDAEKSPDHPPCRQP